MARYATTVFARDSLPAFLDKADVTYFAWSDFYDIRKQLEEML